MNLKPVSVVPTVSALLFVFALLNESLGTCKMNWAHLTAPGFLPLPDPGPSLQITPSPYLF